MWTPNPERLVKISMHRDGEDVETPWAEDLGVDPACAGNRLVRIGNVPYLYAKPTYGDVVSVSPSDDGRLEWNSHNKTYDEIVDLLIAKDGGRWVMIVDYAAAVASDASLADLFRQFDLAAESANIVVEGCYSDHEERTGRAYLAVPKTVSGDGAIKYFARAIEQLTLAVVHPVGDDEGEPIDDANLFDDED